MNLTINLTLSFIYTYKSSSVLLFEKTNHSLIEFPGSIFEWSVY